MPRRKREVYDTGQIAHLWAHATGATPEGPNPTHARNPQENFSFSGEELRSYSTVIAVRRQVKGETVFLHESHSWSSTTNGHQRTGRSASFGHHVYTVPNIHATTYAEHKANVDAYVASAVEDTGKAKRSRKYGRSYLNSAQSALDHAASYAKLFSVRGKIPAIDGLAELSRKANEREAKARAAESKRQREARAEREAYDIALATMMPDLLISWRNGASCLQPQIGDHFPIIPAHRLTEFFGGNVMRIVGLEVETNLGARVPLDMVAVFAPLVLRAMESPNSADRNRLYGRHIGSFTITAIEPDAHGHSGWIVVGCHTFTKREIENIQSEIEKHKLTTALDGALV